MTSQTVIKFDDIFYLRHKNGKYLVSSDKGRYSFPRLDNTGEVKLQLKGSNSSDNLQDGGTVKIRSLEEGLGNNHILGAFSDSHNCYYWKDGYDDDKQSWQIHKVSGDKDVIRYGDEVYFTNVSYKNQRLVADTRHDGFLTTKKNATETWVIESVHKQQPVNQSNTKNPASVFGLSVASGDPSDTGVILWTRINPEKYDKNKPLKYQVCESNKFDNCVIDEEVEASFGKETDFTVHVDLDSKLEAGKTYFYRFHYDGVYSKTGRCKTLPARDTNIDKLRLAVITCNDYSTGYFNAFYHLAKEDIDFVIHLGDFVYEYSQYPPGYGEVYRKDINWEKDSYNQSPLETQRATSLENFQQIYRKYRQDLALQAAMEQHTWMITLDDHEVADNWYWDYGKHTINVGSDHPVFDKTKQEKEKLYNDAIKAWQQYVPARLEKVDKAEKLKQIEQLGQNNSQAILEALEPHEQHIYRHFRFGTLIDFFLTDSRSYRSEPEPDPEKQSPDATMLGPTQKQWLIEGVKNSNAAWKVWGNQTLLATAWANVITANLKGEPGLIDDWQAYMGERREILQAVKDSETKKHGNNDKKSNFVVLTGDMHTSMVSYLKTDFEGVRNRVNMDYSKLAGVEFMTPALTSPGVSEGLREFLMENYSSIVGATEITSDISKIAGKLPNLPFLSDNGTDDAGEGNTLHKAAAALIKSGNSHIEHYNSSINGYAIAEFTASEMIWKVYAINKSDFDVADDGSKISKKGASKHLAKTMKYDPSTIKLDD